MIYVITYTTPKGRVGLMGGRMITKAVAIRTLQSLTDWSAKVGRHNLTVRAFKNMSEACDWRDAANSPKPTTETL